MGYIKVSSIVVLITVQLCHTSVIQSNYQTFSSPKQMPKELNGSDKESSNYGYHHKREPRNIPSNSTKMKNEIKIVNNKFTQNSTGEYKHEIFFSNGAIRIEQGEYEVHNGSSVFVIRGVFITISNEGTPNITLYIVDELGYHSVPPPPFIDPDEIMNYRPNLNSDCGNMKEGAYCIDVKLLQLLVG